MKILIVTQYFWPENFPINDLAVDLLNRGYKITVITGIPNYPEGRFFPGYGVLTNLRQNYQGIKIIRIPMLPRGSGNRLRLTLNYASFAMSASILAPFLLRSRNDLIFVYEPSPVTVGFPAMVLKKIKSIPIFFWVQDLWPQSLSATGAIHSKRILKCVEVMVRLIYKGCDRILVQSRAFFSPIERLGINPNRILYFPNSADALYKPVTLSMDAPERGQLPPGFRVMYAGNIGAAQSFETILDAAEKLKGYPDIHWIIIGDGRIRPWVENQVEQRCLKNTVHLLGRHPAKMMPGYFSLADVLLVTLRKNPIFALTIPSKVQAYLACGKPIIAALDGEGAHVVEAAGAGLSVPAEHPEKLADAVLAMYRMNASELKEKGKNGRAYFIKKFDRTVLLDRLERWIYEEIQGS